MRDLKVKSIAVARKKGISCQAVGDTISWFDGAAVSMRQNNGVGGVIKISEQCCFKWILTCGLGTNTRAKLLGAWALLTLDYRLSIHDIHVQGDSKIIIDWLQDIGRLLVVSLDCWKD
jgi:hypothetical protein